MAKYRVFQDHLMEARVHDIRKVRFCIELDDFLNKLYELFQLRFDEMQDAVWDAQEALEPDGEERLSPGFRLAGERRGALREVGQLPPDGWSTEKAEILEIDKLETDLQNQIDELDAEVKEHLLSMR